ncbi:peptidoglycan-binding domain-containing protein [Rivularia sp. UHCC 0363]|uniref:peptidoglycan-binding domain-containing protein n=1 Tax=Rivularia sp. UHCC 0363 TaxID=3110244 RepID=UPI002B2186DD|nr:peptidoglycan-binding domain-containing protein [Rivularia sp. UHCC 0363]MEA5595437.1 peptidoglycan-binding domain-containing protein [Rivularia sp. UHCC 0363]
MLPVINKTDKGEAVRFLHQLLLSLNLLDNQDFDAEFNSATEQAVRTFQGNNNLTVDGTVGRQTWSRLIDQIGTLCNW